MNYRRLCLWGLVSTSLIAACVSTTIQSVRHVPGFRAAGIHKVLVIGVFKNQALRKTFEEEFVRQWSLRGVHAVSSLEALPPSTTLDKAGVEPIAKAQGFDTVLVARLIEDKIIPPGEPAVSTMGPPSQNNAALQVLLAPPVSTSQFDLATVETNLYDVTAEKRVWSGWSETAVMEKIPKLIPPFVQLILKRIYGTP